MKRNIKFSAERVRTFKCPDIRVVIISTFIVARNCGGTLNAKARVDNRVGWSCL